MTETGGPTAPGAPGAPGVEAGAATPEPVLLDPACRLSESLLWRVHEAYFESSGVGAWSSGDVPHAVTTGPVIALSYARLVEGFVADCAAGRLGAVDPREPLYVVELGAGSGRLGFQLLSALDPDAVAPFPVVYVLTDRVEANLEFWSRNGRFAGLLDAGRVDFARFEAGSADTLHLERSGIDLAPGAVVNPMVGIANYLFDVLPQDLFAVLGETLHEELVGVLADDAGIDTGSKDFFRRIRLSVHHARAAPGLYPPPLGDLLRLAAGRTGPGRRFLFPARAVSAFESLISLSSSRLLMIVGERPERPPSPVAEAATSPSKLVRAGPFLAMGIHGGSISLPVDMSTIADAAALHGGATLLPREPPTSLLVAAIVVGDHGEAAALRSAYVRAVDDLAPDIVHLALGPALRDGGEHSSLRELLSALRLARFDPRSFARCSPALGKLMQEATDAVKDETVATLHRVFEHDYPLDENADLADEIGGLLMKAGRHRDALWFFERSPGHSLRAATLCRMARCHARLADNAVAVALVDRALDLDPSSEEAATLRELLGSGSPVPDA